MALGLQPAVFARNDAGCSMGKSMSVFTVQMPDDLIRRLRNEAARQGRSAEACVLAAIRVWVADCEAATAQARRLGGDPVVRPPDEFWD